MITFPISPVHNQIFTTPTQGFIFDGTKWTALSNNVTQQNFNMTSSTINGQITVPNNTTAYSSPNQIINKSYQDNIVQYRNILMNGTGRISQQYGQNAASVLEYVTYLTSYNYIDRWILYDYQTPMTVQSKPISIPNPTGSTTCHAISMGTLNLNSAGDYITYRQGIPVQSSGNLLWGTPSALPISISFWAQCTAPGTYCGYIRQYTVYNQVSIRVMQFAYTITAANTWQYFSIILPGDQDPSWPLSYLSQPTVMEFGFCLAATSAYTSGTLNQWQNTTVNPTLYFGMYYSGATSLSNQTLSLTNIQLEVNQTTSYERTSFNVELRRCQTFYQQTYDYGIKPGTPNCWSGAIVLPINSTYYNEFSWFLPIPMLSSPTLCNYSPITGAFSQVSINGTDSPNGDGSTDESPNCMWFFVTSESSGWIAFQYYLCGEI